jgi:hypothetical protein
MKLKSYSPIVPRERVTIYLDPRVLKELRVAAARRDKKDSELVEEAIKEHLGIAALERIWARADENPMTDEEAMELALKVTHEVREELYREDQAEKRRQKR